MNAVDFILDSGIVNDHASSDSLNLDML